MAKGRELKGRIKTVENTRKITRTMEMVATSKMKRAADRVLSARPYAIRSRVELTSPVPAQIRAALTLALEHALSLHDAAYLWLAMSLKLPLLTHNRKLAAAARPTVAVLSLEDLA